jgi:hypothetical protein
MAFVTADDFALLLDIVLRALGDVVDEDWSKPARDLDWTCWQTVDHTIDCVFSYALQIAAQAQSGLLPFGELHAQPSAAPGDLVIGLRGVGTMFLAVVRNSPADAVAADGVLMLDLSDWCARAAYEVGLHGYDVVSGLDGELQLPAELCRSIIASPSLLTLDRDRAHAASDPWTGLLVGSGRGAVR